MKPIQKSARTLVVATALLTAFGAAATAQEDSRPNLTIAVAGLPPTLEPAKELSNVGTRITYSVYDTLIRRNFLSEEGGGGSELTPGLAESWERVDDRTLEVRLRSGVTFQNGSGLTAQDVAFTFSPERLTGPDTLLPEGAGYFSTLESVEAVGPLTVRFVTTEPDPLLEQRLASWASWIVNAADWRAKAEETGGLPRFPVGTGPYMLNEFQADQEIRLEAFDDYYGGRPTAQSVTFRAVPEDAARISGLVSGEFDIVTNIAPDQIAQINSYDDIETRSVTLANSHVLVYNTNHPVLEDKRIRQALNLAIDRDLLNAALWSGEAKVPNSHQYPEYGDMYDDNRDDLRYDPEAAKALLEEAGYDGTEIVYSTHPSYYLNALPAAQALVEMWKAVGLNVSLNVTEDLNNLRGDDLMMRNWSNSTRYPDPLGALWLAWGPPGGPQQTWMTWSNDEFNAAGRELEVTTVLEERQALATEMLDIWADDAPGTILYQPLETYGVRKSLKWQPYTFYYMDLRPDNLEVE
ncbi:ABC transporter substrate-binding protein [Oceaniovalibus sp. ACAM 378]|uniref:ABC transporter substrate-binding protein n=1 Tax=Oceaniovalibus sp. ACAM 378 TaxID=2599923 RepID=UPI0011D5BEB9|nr:ABC transporter substrate-binding protein [Oceaniovalibus sp. ACAM 378]TYB85201.1 oligopeptide ABC transporter substrate-binding protein [Oceaniovalibus sp. ACAM 378]